MIYKNIGKPQGIGTIKAYNCDCMELLRQTPDDYYNLAIVDVPYGINHSEIAGKQSGTKYGKAAASKRKYTVKDWDKQIPPAEYFVELRRVSKNQIIWGANYMTEHLPPSMGWVFWDKDNGTNGFSDGELAYTSFSKRLRKVKITWNGMLQQDMKNKQKRIHPTEKPIALYRWLLENYAKEGDTILDTHLGSGSIAIACHEYKFNLTACELDKEYFDAAMKRLKEVQSQVKLFKKKTSKNLCYIEIFVIFVASLEGFPLSQHNKKPPMIDFNSYFNNIPDKKRGFSGVVAYVGVLFLFGFFNIYTLWQ